MSVEVGWMFLHILRCSLDIFNSFSDILPPGVRKISFMLRPCVRWEIILSMLLNVVML